MQASSTDICIIGSGLAGLYAAIESRLMGMGVTVCSKSSPGRGSCTAVSQGQFRTSSATFNPAEHKRLTLEAGRGLNNSEALDKFVQNAAHDVHKLESFGVFLNHHGRGFDPRSDKIDTKGLSITKPMAEYARSIGVRFLAPFFASGIATDDNRAIGLWGVAGSNGQPVLIPCRSLILASGGAGALYSRTDNPQGMTGDGYALALYSGLPLIDMEFVQFHPLCTGRNRTRQLLPSLLCEVGSLENVKGEDIIAKHEIEARPAAIAARDALCQAMAFEVQAGLGFPDGALRLRIHQDQALWDQAKKVYGLENVANLWRLSKKHITKNNGSIPVLPAAHFCMGGIVAGSDGATSLTGLFVAGEVVGGLHGANRYGGNALTEAAVFGRIAADGAFRVAKNLHTPAWSRIEHPDTRGGKSTETDQESYQELRRRIQEIMWSKAGILRSEAALRSAQGDLDALRSALPLTCAHAHGGGRGPLELRNMHTVAEAIVRSARSRKESRGSHFRTDFPYQNEAFDKHILVHRKEKEIRAYCSA